MLNAEQVAERLRTQLAISMRLSWVEECLAFLKSKHASFDSWSEEQQLQAVFGQFLLSDMNVAAQSILPAGITDMHNTTLQGKYVLQVDEVVNMAAPARDRYTPASDSNARMLKLNMTDGVQRVMGVEFQPIKALGWENEAGLKVLVHDVPMRKGLMLLRPHNLVVLGGQVSRLETARQKAVASWNQPPGGKRPGDPPRDIFGEARAAAWKPAAPDQLPGLAPAAAAAAQGPIGTARQAPAPAAPAPAPAPQAAVPHGGQGQLGGQAQLVGQGQVGQGVVGGQGPVGGQRSMPGGLGPMPGGLPGGLGPMQGHHGIMPGHGRQGQGQAGQAAPAAAAPSGQPYLTSGSSGWQAPNPTPSGHAQAGGPYRGQGPGEPLQNGAWVQAGAPNLGQGQGQAGRVQHREAPLAMGPPLGPTGPNAGREDVYRQGEVPGQGAGHSGANGGWGAGMGQGPGGPGPRAGEGWQSGMQGNGAAGHRGAAAGLEEDLEDDPGIWEDEEPWQSHQGQQQQQQQQQRQGQQQGQQRQGLQQQGQQRQGMQQQGQMPQHRYTQPPDDANKQQLDNGTYECGLKQPERRGVQEQRPPQRDLDVVWIDEDEDEEGDHEGTEGGGGGGTFPVAPGPSGSGGFEAARLVSVGHSLGKSARRGSGTGLQEGELSVSEDDGTAMDTAMGGAQTVEQGTYQHGRYARQEEAGEEGEDAGALGEGASRGWAGGSGAEQPYSADSRGRSHRQYRSPRQPAAVGGISRRTSSGPLQSPEASAAVAAAAAAASAAAAAVAAASPNAGIAVAVAVVAGRGGGLAGPDQGAGLVEAEHGSRDETATLLDSMPTRDSGGGNSSLQTRACRGGKGAMVDAAGEEAGRASRSEVAASTPMYGWGSASGREETAGSVIGVSPPPGSVQGPPGHGHRLGRLAALSGEEAQTGCSAKVGDQGNGAPGASRGEKPAGSCMKGSDYAPGAKTHNPAAALAADWDAGLEEDLDVVLSTFHRRQSAGEGVVVQQSGEDGTGERWDGPGEGEGSQMEEGEQVEEEGRGWGVEGMPLQGCLAGQRQRASGRSPSTGSRAREEQGDGVPLRADGAWGEDRGGATALGAAGAGSGRRAPSADAGGMLLREEKRRRLASDQAAPAGAWEDSVQAGAGAEGWEDGCGSPGGFVPGSQGSEEGRRLRRESPGGRGKENVGSAKGGDDGGIGRMGEGRGAACFPRASCALPGAAERAGVGDGGGLRDITRHQQHQQHQQQHQQLWQEELKPGRQGRGEQGPGKGWQGSVRQGAAQPWQGRPDLQQPAHQLHHTPQQQQQQRPQPQLGGQQPLASFPGPASGSRVGPEGGTNTGGALPSRWNHQGPPMGPPPPTYHPIPRQGQPWDQGGPTRQPQGWHAQGQQGGQAGGEGPGGPSGQDQGSAGGRQGVAVIAKDDTGLEERESDQPPRGGTAKDGGARQNHDIGDPPPFMYLAKVQSEQRSGKSCRARVFGTFQSIRNIDGEKRFLVEDGTAMVAATMSDEAQRSLFGGLTLTQLEDMSCSGDPCQQQRASMVNATGSHLLKSFFGSVDLQVCGPDVRIVRLLPFRSPADMQVRAAV